MFFRTLTLEDYASPPKYTHSELPNPKESDSPRKVRPSAPKHTLSVLPNPNKTPIHFRRPENLSQIYPQLAAEPKRISIHFLRLKKHTFNCRTRTSSESEKA